MTTATQRQPMSPEQKKRQIILAVCYGIAIVLGILNGRYGS